MVAPDAPACNVRRNNREDGAMALWVRFVHESVEEFGTLDGDSVRVHAGDMFAGATPTGATIPLVAARLLAPVRPAKFVGLWNNFHAVAAAQTLEIPDFPLFFLKATSAILAPEAEFRAPASYSGRVVYEGELGVVIGRRCSDVSEEDAEAAIFGFTCVNDITAVGLFGDNPKFEQWARAKSCDGFGPVGPAIATGLDWRNARVRTLLNGRERQNYPVSDMILPPPRIVSLLSREMTLEPGDLITCGTSTGVLPMRPGMTVEVAIDGVGVLRNRFAA
jgi:2-keto-4-pentenoate hydratase/2-oxohepta-3-ene-1,7-dioic acid hydratase in catechol pathway